MQFVSFPKIGQYSAVIQDIISKERFIGLDKDENPMFDATKVLPSLTFTGTVKLHGTNSAIAMQGDEYWCQSRERIITPADDNYGFATHFHSDAVKTSVKEIFNRVKEANKIKDPNKIIVLFGEWVGPSVQKNVAISLLPKKSFFLFAIRAISPNKIITEKNQEGVYESDKWLSIDTIKDEAINFFNITDYVKYSIDIDLNNPKPAAETMQGLVDAVEKRCPVAAAFGKEGLGEGIVWEAMWKGERMLFKTKGKEHAVTVHKDNKTVHADPEKVNGINGFCDYCVTEARLAQGIEKVFGTNPLKADKIGDYIRWMINDIGTEEVNALVANKLELKDVQGEISKRSREWLLKKLKGL